VDYGRHGCLHSRNGEGFSSSIRFLLNCCYGLLELIIITLCSFLFQGWSSSVRVHRTLAESLRGDDEAEALPSVFPDAAAYLPNRQTHLATMPGLLFFGDANGKV
jgi:hypothetical protein